MKRIREENMKRTMIVVMVLFFGIGFSVCKKENNSDLVTEGNKGFKNMISIVEIPVTNLSRAIAFYQTILGVNIDKMAMGDTEMGVLPATEGSVNVVLVKGKDYIPTNNGVLIYLDMGNDLQPALEKVEKNGGKVLLPKTEISPEMGYYAMFVDSEGNKIGMHSHR